MLHALTLGSANLANEIKVVYPTETQIQGVRAKVVSRHGNISEHFAATSVLMHHWHLSQAKSSIFAAKKSDWNPASIRTSGLCQSKQGGGYVVSHEKVRCACDLSSSSATKKRYMPQTIFSRNLRSGKNYFYTGSHNAQVNLICLFKPPRLRKISVYSSISAWGRISKDGELITLTSELGVLMELGHGDEQRLLSYQRPLQRYQLTDRPFHNASGNMQQCTLVKLFSENY